MMNACITHKMLSGRTFILKRKTNENNSSVKSQNIGENERLYSPKRKAINSHGNESI